MTSNETKPVIDKEAIKVGVLALQGDFKEHIDILKKVNVPSKEVRLPDDLDDVSGLIIPGGESTTITKLLIRCNLFKKIIENARTKSGTNYVGNKEGMAIYGTCAGAILLAKNILNSNQPSLGLMDISVERNAYGRQIESFEAGVYVKNIGRINGVFIRAPIIKKTGKNVEVLAELNGNVVAARQNNILISTFHPELSGNTKVHKFFVEMIKN